MRRVPIIPTLIVLAAVAVMVSLGFWQLGRKQEKEALIAEYTKSVASPEYVEWPESEIEMKASLYRASKVDCESVISVESRAGININGEAGWAHIARCSLADEGEAEIAIGWTSSPTAPDWSGGEVLGMIGPGGILYAFGIQPILPLALPNPNNIPNNHLAYAVQWFFFALTALVIYALVLRKRMRE